MEIFNGVLKRYIERILTFQRNRNWVAALPIALKIYNNTVSPSLQNLSPTEALHLDNIPKLQAFYLKKRAKKNKPFLQRKPYFHLNQSVKKIVIDRFKQRGHRPRFSDKTFRITQVLDDAVPIAYHISEHGKKLFYKEELVATADLNILNESVTSKKILGIISSKQFAIKWLRSGKPIEFEKRFLVRSNLSEKAEYLTREQIADYDNGIQLLNQFEEMQK